MTRQPNQKSGKQAYTGALAEPLRPRFRRRFRRTKRHLRLNSSVASAAAPSLVPEWRPEYDQKLPLLLDHFGIGRDDPNCWYKLSLCLAVAHILGFQERRKGGRPRSMTREEERKLCARFCELREDGHSDRNAARLIANDLRKAGRMVSDASILRRMQRIPKNAEEFAAFIARLSVGIGVTQYSPGLNFAPRNSSV